MRIAYLGPRGSFTHHVASHAFPDAELVAFKNITEAIKAFENAQVEYSVIPVENSIEGSVHETLDYLFHQANIHAVAEIIQPIAQHLMATKSTKDIQKIFSHPQAIAQGQQYIREHYPHATIEMTASTAYAAQLVSEHSDEPYAAIAPQGAAHEYGLEIIANDIQEMDENYTRFWILGKEEINLQLPHQERKLSLALTLPNNLPGALYKAMSVFAWRGIDLTKIESRPLKTALGEYFFIMDLMEKDGELVQFALKELTSLGISYKILGSYLIYTVK